jgi:hypothetical protein
MTATATASSNNNSNNNQAAPDCWLSLHACYASRTRPCNMTTPALHTKQPSSPWPSPAGPVRHPTDSRAARRLHVAQPSAPEFTAPVAPCRRPQLVHVAVASYSVLPRPGASSAGNIPCLARLSRGIGSAIPAHSTCCSCCSFPARCELEPASRLSVVARRPLPLVQPHPTKSATQLAACILI